MTEPRPAFISLRALGFLAAVLLAAASLGLAAMALGWRPESLRNELRGTNARQAPIARRIIVYRLEPDRPIVFRFTQPLSLARVVTVPTVGPGQASPGESWTYAFQAELLDEAGMVMERRQIFARAGMFERNGARIGSNWFFRDRDDLPATGDEVRIASQRPFTAIRLRATVANPDVLAVTVRVSERRPLLRIAADSAFARFSPEDRRRLSLANAFPPELLTPDERRNIAINQWKPIGPVGIEGRDYRMDVLYEEVESAAAIAEPKDRADGE